MASIYGYSQALSEGHSYNARIQAHNDLVNEHNTKVLADYDLAVKEQKRAKADDKHRKKKMLRSIVLKMERDYFRQGMEHLH